MLRLLADENFNGHIFRGLVRRIPDLDAVRAQDIEELYGCDDPVLLRWAADERRVIVTHDVSTMGRFAYARLLAGEPMPGVFEVPSDLPIGQAIDDLELIARASLPGEWEGQVRYLPL